MNKNNIKWIPKNSFFNAPDLVEKIIEMNLEVRTFPHWIIGWILAIILIIKKLKPILQK